MNKENRLILEGLWLLLQYSDVSQLPSIKSWQKMAEKLLHSPKEPSIKELTEEALGEWDTKDATKKANVKFVKSKDGEI